MTPLIVFLLFPIDKVITTVACAQLALWQPKEKRPLDILLMILRVREQWSLDTNKLLSSQCSSSWWTGSIAVRLPINRSTWYDIWGLILFILWSIFICIFKINICDIFDKIHFFMLWLHSETSVFRMYFIFVSMKNPNSAMPITTLKIRRLYDSLTFLKWNSYTVTTASFGQLWVVLSHGQGSAETYIHTYIHTYKHTYLLLLISMLWHRQAIFKSKGNKLCSSAECRIWTRGPRHQIASRLNARWQTDWAIEDQAKKLELDSPSLWSASIQPTWPHRQLTFAPGSGDIHICCC